MLKEKFGEKNPDDMKGRTILLKRVRISTSPKPDFIP